MPTRDGVEPSSSAKPTADTTPLDRAPAPGSGAEQARETVPGWPSPGGSPPAGSPPWGWDASEPTWGQEPPAGPSWQATGTTQTNPERPAWAQPERSTDPNPTQPVWGQGGGSGWGAGPAGPAWGERSPGADGGGRRPARLLAALGLATILLAGGYGIGQALDRNPSSSAGIPAPAASSPAVSAPVKGGAEPVAAVAAALMPSIVEIRTGSGLGSGFIYDKNGYIMTAAHVVQGGDQVQVRLADGAQLSGRVLGTDRINDVAVVKVDRSNLPTAPLALGVRLQVGQMAVAIGSPFGLDQTVTAGVVSATSRAIGGQTGNGRATVREVIQTDAPINPGNSGGALADRQGRIIGINDAIASDNGNNNGVGFAVPIDIAARSAAAIVRGEPIRTAYLGVSFGESATSTGSQGGALVEQVVPGGPADKAGLEVGDRITALDGQAVKDNEDLAARIRALAPGRKVEVKVVRNGQEQTVTATLAENPNG
jgi:putative serine protease PepD